jgi:hypothetical protein
MTQRNKKVTDKPRDRELVLAYLSYALEDVRALSEISVYFLRMAIASIGDEAEISQQPAKPILHH